MVIDTTRHISKAIAVCSVSVSKELALAVSKTQTVIQSTGRIKHHLEQWGKLTSAPHILNIVRGCKIEFDQPPLVISGSHLLKPNLAQTRLRQLIKRLQNTFLNVCL